jgi:uncharacterized protein YdeI (YjbR/CyaY-like superfamily)
VRRSRGRRRRAAFRANQAGWYCFQATSALYRKAAIWWVVSAKKEETIRKRLAALIADSAAGRKIAFPARPSARTPST